MGNTMSLPTPSMLRTSTLILAAILLQDATHAMEAAPAGNPPPIKRCATCGNPPTHQVGSFSVEPLEAPWEKHGEDPITHNALYLDKHTRVLWEESKFEGGSPPSLERHPDADKLFRKNTLYCDECWSTAEEKAEHAYPHFRIGAKTFEQYDLYY